MAPLRSPPDYVACLIERQRSAGKRYAGGLGSRTLSRLRSPSDCCVLIKALLPAGPESAPNGRRRVLRPSCSGVARCRHISQLWRRQSAFRIMRTARGWFSRRVASACLVVLGGLGTPAIASAAGPLWWSAPVRIPPADVPANTPLTGAACPSTSVCVLSDSAGDFIAATRLPGPGHGTALTLTQTGLSAPSPARRQHCAS